jgi:allantoinase
MKKLKNSPTVLMFHAEMLPPISTSVGDSVLHGGQPCAPSGPLDSYKTFLESRPPSFETYAIEGILELAPIAPDLQLHIVHLSAAEGIPLLKSAREAGVKLTAETCFHYLTLAAEDIGHGDTRHKCCPPIREGANREFLWDALKTNLIETVVSDHSPCTAGLKMLKENGGDGDFFQAWGGISTVGLGLSVLWTDGRTRNITLPQISTWTSYNTAKQVGLLGQKGAFVEGWDADICVFDHQAEFKVCSCHFFFGLTGYTADIYLMQVTTKDMHFKNKVTPYENKTLVGRVCETWLRGRRIYSTDSGFDKTGPRGEMLINRREHLN